MLATNLPLFPGRLQLPVTLRVDLLLPPSKHVLRRDVARRAVQADVVVVVHVTAYQTPGMIERQRRSRRAARLREQLRFLLENLLHPSLHSKKYDESKNLWQARVTNHWRFYFTITEDTYRIEKIIPHPK